MPPSNFIRQMQVLFFLQGNKITKTDVFAVFINKIQPLSQDITNYMWHASKITKTSLLMHGCRKCVFREFIRKPPPRTLSAEKFVAVPSKVKEIIFTPTLCNMTKQPLIKFARSSALKEFHKK
jgi:hypothetical protein